MLKRLFERLDRWAEQMALDSKFIWKLFFVALFVRVVLVLLHPHVHLISDMLGYHESAVSLLQNGDFRVKGRLSASRPPLYSIFMFMVYYVFGTGNIFAVRLLQCILGACTAVLTLKLAQKVFSNKAGVWAGLFFALYPAAWGYCDLILSETLFTFLLVAGLIFLVDVPEGQFHKAFIAGILLGMATLTRTVLVQFPLFLALFYLVFSRKRLTYLPKLALFVITFWIVLIPWMARNERVFGEPLLTTKSGVDFYMYNHNPFRLILLNYSLEGKEVLDGVVPWQLSEMERDKLCRNAGIEWVQKHPWLFLFKGVRMQWNFFGVEREYIWSLIAGYWGGIPRWQLFLSFLIFAPTIYILMPLFIWGVVYSWKNFRAKQNLLLLIGYFLAVTFVYYGFSRHRTPLNPIMMSFAGFAMTAWPKIFADLKPPGILRKPQTSIALAILAFFIIGWILEIFMDVGTFLNLRFTHAGWHDVGNGM